MLKNVVGGKEIETSVLVNTNNSNNSNNNKRENQFQPVASNQPEHPSRSGGIKAAEKFSEKKIRLRFVEKAGGAAPGSRSQGFPESAAPPPACLPAPSSAPREYAGARATRTGSNRRFCDVTSLRSKTNQRPPPPP